MLEKRIKHQRIIIKQKTLEETEKQKPSFDEVAPSVPQEEADEEDLHNTFSTVIAQKKRTNQKPFDPNRPKKRRTMPKSTKDEENYINYVAKDHLTETG